MNKRDIYFGGGLLLRVRGESASWVFRFASPAGRRREMGLGIAELVNGQASSESIAAVTRLHQDAKALVKSGIDPIDKRASESASRAAEARRLHNELNSARKQRAYWTLARCARGYHERAIEPSRTSKHAAQWISTLENHIPEKLWGSPISAISERDLLNAVISIRPDARNRKSDADLTETKARICQRLVKVFDDAICSGLLERNPASRLWDRVKEHSARRPVENYKAIDYKNAPALVELIHRENSTAALALEFGILTAARTSEILGATWNEIDLDSRRWTIPAKRMKARRPHVVHLSTEAIKCLVLAVGLHPSIIFPSPVLDDKPLSSMAMLNVLGRLGVRERTTVHGLCRATFSTWAHETGAARPEVIDAALAHVTTKDKRAYNRAEYLAERKELLDQWAKYLKGVA